MSRAYATSSHSRPGRLDEITNTMRADEGLHENVAPQDLQDAIAAADSMNRIILQGMREIGALDNKEITVDEVRAINDWIRSNDFLENKWVSLHGDDEGDSETGFHKVQNDGATTQYHGQNFFDTVVDGIYHIGFEIKNDHFLNEDGNENASVQDVAHWLTDLTFNNVDIFL